jgi:hypothetical protein
MALQSNRIGLWHGLDSIFATCENCKTATPSIARSGI